TGIGVHQAKNRVLPEAGVIQSTVESRTYQRPCVIQRDTAADSVRSCDPAGIDQPHPDIMTLQLVAQQFCIIRRVQREERLAETSGEYCFGFGNTYFGTSYLRRIAGNKMIHGLCWTKPGNRGYNTESIRCQKKDITRMPRRSGKHAVLNIMNRISHTRIL